MQHEQRCLARCSGAFAHGAGSGPTLAPAKMNTRTSSTARFRTAVLFPASTLHRELPTRSCTGPLHLVSVTHASHANSRAMPACLCMCMCMELHFAEDHCQFASAGLPHVIKLPVRRQLHCMDILQALHQSEQTQIRSVLWAQPVVFSGHGPWITVAHVSRFVLFGPGRRFCSEVCRGRRNYGQGGTAGL